MVSVRRRRARPDEVGIELELVGDEVLANIWAPTSLAPDLRIVRVRLDEAVVIAIRLSRRFNADVAIIDREGLWPG